MGPNTCINGSNQHSPESWSSMNPRNVVVVVQDEGEEEEKKKNSTNAVLADDTATKTTMETETMDNLIARLKQVEQERDHWKDSFERSNDENAALKAKNEGLKSQSQRETDDDGRDHQDDDDDALPSPRQQQQEATKDSEEEIKRLQTALERVNEESAAKIIALEDQVTVLQAIEASLLDDKNRLEKRINSLVEEGESEKHLRLQRNRWGSRSPKATTKAKTSTKGKTIPPPLPELRDLRDQLDTIDLGKEQGDFVAEAVKKRTSNRFIGTDPDMEEYGYKIPMPPDEAFEEEDETRVHPSEIIGEEVYVPDPVTENHDKHNNKSNSNNGDDSSQQLPWWDEVSLDFEDDQAHFIKEVANRRKSIFDRIFGD